MVILPRSILNAYMNLKKIIFIVGPTAVGKSDVALCVARNIKGEIISCDSMQIYKDIHIASNKPTKEALDAVPHHLVGILSVEEEFDVAQFNQNTLEIIKKIHDKGHVPIIVGGSGMYMQVLLDGIFKGGVRNEALRKDLQEQAKQNGNEYLYGKLKEVDPVAASKIHPNDLRRVIRALEIGMTRQIPISDLQKDREGLWGKYDICLFMLDRQRKELYERINVRVEKMFDDGIVEEVKKIEEGRWGRTAGKIIGVQEVREFLRDEYGMDETKERIKLNTRHLAKRQLTWFRREKRLNWIALGPDDTAQSVAHFIVNEGENAKRKIYE